MSAAVSFERNNSHAAVQTLCNCIGRDCIFENFISDDLLKSVKTNVLLKKINLCAYQVPDFDPLMLFFLEQFKEISRARVAKFVNQLSLDRIQRLVLNAKRLFREKCSLNFVSNFKFFTPGVSWLFKL